MGYWKNGGNGVCVMGYPTTESQFIDNTEYEFVKNISYPQNSLPTVSMDVYSSYFVACNLLTRTRSSLTQSVFNGFQRFSGPRPLFSVMWGIPLCPKSQRPRLRPQTLSGHGCGMRRHSLKVPFPLIMYQGVVESARGILIE